MKPTTSSILLLLVVAVISPIIVILKDTLVAQAVLIAVQLICLFLVGMNLNSNKPAPPQL